MTQTGKRYLSMLLAAGMALSIAFLPGERRPVFAESVQDQIDQAAQEKQEALDNLNNSKEKKEEQLVEREKIDQEIDIISTEINTIDSIISEADAQIAEKEAEIADYEAQIAENEDEFCERLRAMDETSTASYIDILLNSESISDFLSNVETLREISAHDHEIISNLADLKSGVEEARNTIVEKRDEQQQARNLADGKKDELEAKMAEKNAYIQSLENDIEEYERVYNEKEAQEQELKESLKSSLSTSSSISAENPVIYASSGEYCWPAPDYTYVSSQFGYRVHPILGTTKYHSGTDLASPHGTRILAAASGTVTMASWNGGYGNCVVVDHGNGMATLYGHCSQLLVSAGQTVQKGQQIAKVGSTGLSSGPHLHFELLINGSSADPMSLF